MRIDEWLLAGEYILSNNNPNLMFCERGIRTFEPTRATRWIFPRFRSSKRRRTRPRD